MYIITIKGLAENSGRIGLTVFEQSVDIEPANPLAFRRAIRQAFIDGGFSDKYAIQGIEIKKEPVPGEIPFLPPRRGPGRPRRIQPEDDD